MPELQPADPADYVLCKECSAKKGREAFILRDHVVTESKPPGLFRKSRDDLGTTVYKCPAGHVLDGYTPVPA